MSEDGIDRDKIYKRWNDPVALARGATPKLRRTVTDASRPEVRDLLYREAFGRGIPPDIIEQERRGLDELLASDVLPVRGSGHPALAMIEWGEPVPDDPLFRFAWLPEGWSRRATEDHRTFEVVDDAGAARAVVFYKAAFYDRKADIYPVASR